MAEVLTESFCERCGTRYTFESAQPRIKRFKGVKVLSRGLKNFVLSDDSSLDEAMAAARSDTDREVTAHQLDAFHKTFNFCMTCRQYTCANCWNEGEGACLTCSPHLGREILPAPFPDLDPSLGITMALGAEVASGNGANGNGHAPHTLEAGAWPTSDLVQPVDEVSVPTEAIDEVDVEARMAALTAIGIDQPSATDTASDDAAPPEDDGEAASMVAGSPAEGQVEAEVAAEAEIAVEAVEGVEAVEMPTEIAVEATTEPRAPTTTDEVAAAAVAQTAALFHRFRPGQNLDDEIEAYEREQSAATTVSASEATVAPEPAPINADDEAERAAAAALAVAALAEATDLAEAAAPVATDSAVEELAAERRPTDIVAQPTWQIVAPDIEPAAPVAVPAAPSAPSTPPAVAAAALPAWPAKPEWPSNQPAAALPFLGRMAQPTGGLESLWAESNREVASAAPPDPGRPAPGGVQPCVSCGLSLSATARFCRRCGTSQVA